MGAGSSSIKGLSAQQVLELIGEYLHSRNFTLESAFSFLDKDDSGFLSFDEFVHGFRLCTEGMGVDEDHTLEKLHTIFVLFDTSQDADPGGLSIAEFVQAFAPKTGYGTTYYDYDFYSRSRQAPGSVSFASTSALNSTKREQRFREELFTRVATSIKRLGTTSRELFEKADANRSNDLSRQEIQELCWSVQPDLSKSELQVIFEHFDSNHDDSITKDEFCNTLDDMNGDAVLKVETSLRSIAERLRKRGYSVNDAFFVFDRNGDGNLNLDEWRRAISLFSKEPISEADLRFVFQRFDVDDAGSASISELQRFFCESLDRVRRCADQPSDHLKPKSEEQWETRIYDTVRDQLGSFRQMRSDLDMVQIFQRMNTSRSGALTLGEFEMLISSCCNLTPILQPEQLQQLFQKLDLTGSNSISYGEFVRRFG